MNRRVSGPFAGTTFFELSTSGCNLVHQVLDGSYAPVQGRSGSFHIDVCPSFGADGGNVDSGTFTMRDPNGATLEGWAEMAARRPGVARGQQPSAYAEKTTA